MAISHYFHSACSVTLFLGFKTVVLVDLRTVDYIYNNIASDGIQVWDFSVNSH